MKWLLLGLLFIASPVFALTDPLSSQFQPVIDTNSADYNTALGTITITDSLYKVWQSSVAPGTQKWIQIYLMQNEIQSFQVHVTPTNNLPNLTVSVSSLTNAQTGTVISSATTDIVVYREYYLNISTPTAYSTTTYQGGARAMMPDPLIPAKDPYYNQTTNAFPVAVTAGNTQSSWVDIHIPSSAPSGYYSGHVYVSSGSTLISDMPVVFAVWAWLMPSTASFATVGAGFGYNGMCDISYGGTANCGTYPGASGSADTANTLQWIDGAVQMLDNRWTIDEVSNIYPESGSFATYNQFIGPLMNGTTANTKTILPGAALTKNYLNNISFTSSEWQNYASSFTNSGWFPRLFFYLVDEPSSGQWAAVIASGTSTRTFSTPIIPNLVTTDLTTAQAHNGQGIIDWITPIIENVEYPGTLPNTRASYDSYLATSSGPVRLIGSYQDCESAGTCSNGTIGPANTPRFPNRHVDGTPVANRAFETWAYLNRMNFELYFAVDLLDTTGNPWNSVYAFGCNGDGTLMYPSSSTYVTTSGGTPIWVPSMRIKYFRDGEQDYEYEKHLNDVGQGTLVSTQIASWMTNGYTFNNSPAGIEAARIAMGTAIHQLTYPSGGGGSNSGSFSGSGKFSGGGTIQ
jgi:hypothetical protein